MKNNLLRNTIIAGVLCTTLIAPVFAEEIKLQSTTSKNAGVIPISVGIGHWAEIYIEQLSENHDMGLIFKDKNLNSATTVQDFQNMVRLVIDKEYNGEPDSMTREAAVHELTRLWAEKTGQDLDSIPVIKMLIYSDTDKIEAKYNHSVTVAYMRNIAHGVGARVFNPKANVTYGELAALADKTSKAIENELKPANQPIVKGSLETRGIYEVKEGKVMFAFELMSHYTEPKELKFGSGQQFELTITDEKGEEVYKYSDGKFFTLALVMKTIGPGEAIKWQDEWDITNKDGEKLSSGKYKAEIKVMVITEEGEEKIDENQLTKVIEFTL